MNHFAEQVFQSIAPREIWDFIDQSDHKGPSYQVWPSFFTTVTNANNSFSYVDKSKLLPLRVWLWKANGLWFCIRTTLKPVPEASYSITKGLVKLGKASTGGYDIACLRVLKANLAWADHWKESFLSRAIGGVAIIP